MRRESITQSSSDANSGDPNGFNLPDNLADSQRLYLQLLLDIQEAEYFVKFYQEKMEEDKQDLAYWENKLKGLQAGQ